MVVHVLQKQLIRTRRRPEACQEQVCDVDRVCVGACSVSVNRYVDIAEKFNNRFTTIDLECILQIPDRTREDHGFYSTDNMCAREEKKKPQSLFRQRVVHDPAVTPASLAAGV